MKNRFIILAVGILMVCLLPLAVSAQQQEWQSTSSMQESGSRYSSKVTPVGATGVGAMSSTTSSFAPSQAPSGPRRDPIYNGEGDEGWVDKPDIDKTQLSPLGDAVLPLMLMAFAFSGILYLRRRKQTA